MQAVREELFIDSSKQYSTDTRNTLNFVNVTLANEYNVKTFGASPLDFTYGSDLGNAEAWQHHINLEIKVDT